MEEIDNSEISRAVGEKLRQIRKEQRLSLHDVEENSKDEFKASVVGAYERGERSISVARLLRLCEHYHVSPNSVLPSETTIDLVEEEGKARKIVIDLSKVANNNHAEAMVIGRFAQSVHQQRSSSSGRFLTLRSDDMRILSAVFGKTIEEFTKRLAEIHLLADQEKLSSVN
ncbi:MAG: transcriptional regulator [Acidimicrobiia bacterium]